MSPLSCIFDSLIDTPHRGRDLSDWGCKPDIRELVSSILSNVARARFNLLGCSTRGSRSKIPSMLYDLGRFLSFWNGRSAQSRGFWSRFRRFCSDIPKFPELILVGISEH